MSSPSRRNPRAYVAGPITSSGSLHENLHNGIKVGDELMTIGIHPFIPHLYDFTKIVTGRDADWESMLKMDENWITACDLLVALPGESRGKAREMAFARARHIPVVELEHNTVFEQPNLYGGCLEDKEAGRRIVVPMLSFLMSWESKWNATPQLVS